MTNYPEKLLHTLDIRREFGAPAFPVHPIPPETMRNGVVVRMPNWLGDAVMALPALRQLKDMLPEHCALAVIAPRGMRSFYHALPWVDLILPLRDTHRRWRLEELLMVRRFSPGFGVLFNNSFRDALMLRLAGAGPLYGASARCRSWLLRRSFSFPGRHDHELNRMHHANKYLAIVRALGAPEWDGTLPEIRIARPFFQLAPEVRALCDHPKLLILAAGAAYGAAKRWRSENFNRTAAVWIARGGIAATVGTAKEAPIGAEIAAGLPPNKFFNMMGKTDMTALMYLVRSARAVVANDSGVMHLAAAMGRPGVAVFGSTDYSATGPIGTNWKILYSDRSCSPCFARTCPRNNPECMTDIPAEAAIAALEDMF